MFFKDVQFAQIAVAGNTIPNAAFVANPTAGDVCVSFVSAFASATDPTPTAPTDTDSNTHTQIDVEQTQGSVIGLSIWICKNMKNSAGSCVVTGHISNAGTGTIVSWLLSGLRNDTPYNNDVQYKNVSSAAATPVNTATPLANNPKQCVFLAAMTPGGSGTFTFPNWNSLDRLQNGDHGYQSAFSLRCRGTNNSTSQALYTQQRVSDSGSANVAQWLDSLGTDTWISAVLSFAPQPNVKVYSSIGGVVRRSLS